MKNKSVIEKKQDNGDLHVYKLKLSAFALKREFTDKERKDLRLQRLINLETTMTVRNTNLLGESIQIFKFYVVKKGNFLQLVKHRFCMVTAAIFDYIGISTIIILNK